MNNDISRDITSYNSKVQIPTGRIELSKTTETMPAQEIEPEQGTNAMECLGAMGCAQVNMGKDSIRKSVEEFASDPYEAEMKMEFCDNLINEKGYDVWQAIDITDSFFKILKQEETYKD